MTVCYNNKDIEQILLDVRFGLFIKKDDTSYFLMISRYKRNDDITRQSIKLVR